MKEAVGQTISLEVILVFMIFLNAFLAFSVNYTKAFRVKNKVINAIEQYEGITPSTKTAIDNYIKTVGYSVTTKSGEKDWRNGVKVEAKCVGPVGGTTSSNSCKNPVKGTKYKVYYSVTTVISFNVPIIGPVLKTITSDVNLLQVNGDTSIIYIDGKNLNDKMGWTQ